MSPEDGASISEINILPDGRVCVFGMSRQVLEVLNAIPLDDPNLRNRIDSLHDGDVKRIAESNDVCSVRNDEVIKNQARP